MTCSADADRNIRLLVVIVFGAWAMDIALYSRVSTDRQEVENQLVELRAEARKRGVYIFREYVDEDVSASKIPLERRKVGKELVEGIKSKLFEAVWVWRLDRLTREGIDATRDLLAFMKRYDIKLFSLKEPEMNTDNELVKAILIDVLAWVAKQEAIKISERTKANLNIVKTELAEHGWHMSKKGNRITHLGHTAMLKDKTDEIKKLQQEGWTLRSLASKYSCSTTAIRTVLGDG